jgi:hypothetical protein
LIILRGNLRVTRLACLPWCGWQAVKQRNKPGTPKF